MMNDDEDSLDKQYKSKTQIKREMLELQKLGEQLVILKAEVLARLKLPTELMHAIQAAKAMKSHGAKRRQLQYIGRLMRKVDAEPILDFLAEINLQHERSIALLHMYETWRNRLITEGALAFSAFIDKYPSADRQQLKQLIMNAQKELNHNKTSGAGKALLRYIRELDLVEQSQRK